MKQDGVSSRVEKAGLRETMLARRDGLDPAFRAEASARMAIHAQPLLAQLPAGAVIAGFFPMRSEIDPRPLMQALAGRGLDCLSLLRRRMRCHRTGSLCPWRRSTAAVTGSAMARAIMIALWPSIPLH